MLAQSATARQTPPAHARRLAVHLDFHKYQCFDARCQSHGDIIDLWAALHRLSLRDAALDLIRTFDLEPAPATEKRNG